MTLCQHGVQSGAGYECSACVTTPADESAVDAAAAALKEIEALRLEAGAYGDTCEEYGAVRSSARTLVPALERIEVAWAAVTGRLDRIEQYLRSEKR